MVLLDFRRFYGNCPQPYEVSLCIATPSEIGNDRLAVNMSITGELIVFYPPTHPKRVLADGRMEYEEGYQMPLV